MEPSKKKQLLEAYRQREIIGGIYAIRCAPTGKAFMDSAVDLAGIQNRFQFSLNTKTCIHQALQADWRKYGTDAFSFEVLETVAKKEEESMEEYKHGLSLMRDCLKAEMAPEERY